MNLRRHSSLNLGWLKVVAHEEAEGFLKRNGMTVPCLGKAKQID